MNIKIPEFNDACSFEILQSDDTSSVKLKLAVNKAKQNEFIMTVIKKNLLDDKPQDGFRKGSSIKEISDEAAIEYGNQISNRNDQTIREAIIHDAIDRFLGMSIEDTSIAINGEPLRPIFTKEGEDSVNDYYVVTIGILNKITDFSFLDELKIDQIKYEPSPEELLKTEQEMLSEKYDVEVTDCDRAATDGDTVEIDFKGYLTVAGNNKRIAFKGGSADNYKFPLGKGQMLPEFEDGVRGLKIGCQKTIKMSFPANYHAKDLAGMPVEFEIKLNKIYEGKEYGDTETYVHTMNPDMVLTDSDSTNLVKEKFDEAVKNRLERTLIGKIKTIEKDQIMEAISEHFHDIKLPEKLLNDEYENIKNAYQSNKEAEIAHEKECTDETHDHSHGKSKDMTDEELKAVARTKVIIMIVFMNIISHFHISVDQNDLIMILLQESQNSGISLPELIGYYQSNEHRMEHLKKIALESKVIDLIKSKSIKEEKIMSGSEIEALYKKVMEEETA